jgi:hypothetical protein
MTFTEVPSMKHRLAMIISIACCLTLFSPSDLLAAGFLWPTAGPYVNEIAHLLFLGAMIFFIYEIRSADLNQFLGFRYLFWAWVLMALWNLDAFWGRLAAWYLTGPLLSGEGLPLRIQISDVASWIVFITQITNFILLVPAFYLLYRGIKALANFPRAQH